MAFNIHDKISKGPEDLKLQQKQKLPQQKQNVDEIKNKVSEVKSKRIQDKQQKEKEEKEKYEKDREALRKMHEKLRKDKARNGGGYLDIRQKGGDSVDKNLKVTFAVIEKMHYTDFNNGLEGDDFKPSDIVDIVEKDQLEDEILKRFNSNNSGTNPY